MAALADSLRLAGRSGAMKTLMGPYPRSWDTGLDYAADGSVAAVSLWQAVS
jgi:hypothetical protein